MAKSTTDTKPGASQPPAPAAKSAKTTEVRLRSRFPNYCVRGVPFRDHVAIVTPAERDGLRGVREFGPGLDFWEEQPVAAEPTPAAAPATADA